MKADILTVGAVSPAVTAFLSRELPACGLTPDTPLSVDTTGGALREALQGAMRRTDCIVLCASDEQNADKELAALLGLPWEEERPRGAVSLCDAAGTPRGFAVEKYAQLFLFLPADEDILSSLLQHALLPFFSERGNGAFVSRTVGVFGLTPAAVTERLSDRMAAANPTITLTARTGGEVLVRITAHAATAEEAAALCAEPVGTVCERLGSYVFGVDTNDLQTAVVHLLKEKQMKVATAESCTAGLLSGKLTQVAGASSVFECGIAAYSKEIKHDVLGVSEDILKTQGAVSADTARAMAVGVRRVGGSELGVSITGEAGPTSGEGKPVGTVYIALADDRRVWVKELHVNAGDRDTVRAVATAQALDLTRRYLEAYPTVMAGGELLEAGDHTPAIPMGEATGHRRFLAFILPWRGDRPALWVAKTLVWLSVLAFCVFGWFLLDAYVIDPAQNREQYVSLELLYDREHDGSYNAADFPRGMLARFYALYQKNNDIRGWVRIGDTGISYPVMQNGRYDYTATDFSGRPSHYGVPYFDEKVTVASPLSVNRSYIIHGNNTEDGQMFSDLIRYTDANFLLRHTAVEMNTLYTTGTFEVFAVLYADENDPSFDYRAVSFDSNEDFLAFTAELQARSLFITSVTPQKDDTLLLLETDASAKTGVDGIRLIVAARRLSLGEPPGQDTVISYNPHTVYPAAMSGNTTTTTATTSATTTVFQSSDIVPDIEMPVPDMTDTTERGTTAATTAPTTGRKTTVTAATTVATTAASTTAASTTEPATTTTIPHGTPSTGGETAFFRGIKVNIGGEESTLQTREDLQYAVACAVKTEMGAARTMQNSVEAQKAQAVASYTYMLYSCMSGGTFSISSRIDLANPTDRKLYDAVGEVVGVKMVDTAQTIRSRMPICAMYSSSTGGASASCQHVYTAALPYLQSVESRYDTEEYVKKYSGNDSLTATHSLTFTQLKALLAAYVSKETAGAVTAVSFEDGATPLFAKSYDGNGGYVVDTNAYYEHEGKRVYLRGIDIRKAIGSGTLRSHSFTVTYDAVTDRITFTTRGHGHGLGLSQYGAIGYANEEGWSWRQILNHYYSLTDGGRYTIVLPVWE
ncbi:MAG: nicotinamide-nucleotide amidohydrolase family protein [Ruminococcaceae bacterium]|nr:nicotinamide-nucleotide amidohydrolase family protein [Oscillospiraceae bacterium]